MHHQRAMNPLDICMDYGHASNSSTMQPSSSSSNHVSTTSSSQQNNNSGPTLTTPPPPPPPRPTSSQSTLLNSSPNLILSTGFHYSLRPPQPIPSSNSSSVTNLDLNTVAKRFEYTSEKHPKLLLESLSILRRRRELCDVVLIVGQRKIYAHRVLLAAYSPNFLGENH